VNEYNDKYLTRHPIAADMDSSLKTMNDSIYSYMQGPSEFTITGTLKDYDGTSYLKDVKVPVLYTVGEFDEADPATVKRFASMTPGATLAVIPNAAHITMWDNGPAMLSAVRSFLRRVDSTTKR
jgi:proline iminopeptidase